MSARVVCVSPNTSTDRVSIVDGFEVGGTFRTVASFDQAGGSGSHAQAWVVELGVTPWRSWRPEAAMARVGARATRQRLPFAAAGLRREEPVVLRARRPPAGQGRRGGRSGPELDPGEVSRLTDLVKRHDDDADLWWFRAACRRRFRTIFTACCIDLARAVGCRTLVDAHTRPLREAPGDAAVGDKPNLDELHQLMGATHSTMAERIDAVRQLARESVELVLLSMEAEGMLLATAEGVWRLCRQRPPSPCRDQPGSTRSAAATRSSARLPATGSRRAT